MRTMHNGTSDCFSWTLTLTLAALSLTLTLAALSLSLWRWLAIECNCCRCLLQATARRLCCIRWGELCEERFGNGTLTSHFAFWVQIAGSWVFRNGLEITKTHQLHTPVLETMRVSVCVCACSCACVLYWQES